MSATADDGREEFARGEYPDEITCDLCGERYTYDRTKRTTKHTCRSCMINRHRFSLKVKMVEYKGGGCQLCGYRGSMRSLDFHHLDPAEKEFDFGGKHNLGAERLLKELAKCVCLCRNCHGEIHEAEEAVNWGHDPAPILNKVKAAHDSWKPPEPKPDLSRGDWQDHHPKFVNHADRTEQRKLRPL